MNQIAIAPAKVTRSRACDTVETHERVSEFYLWRAVIGQAVRDVYGQNDARRREVFVWTRTKDFLHCCDMAAVNPASIREQLEALGALPQALAKRFGMELRELLLSA